MNLGAYSKTIAALVTGVLGWAAVVIASPAHAISASEWLELAVVAATALGVYGVANATTPASTAPTTMNYSFTPGPTTTSQSPPATSSVAIPLITPTAPAAPQIPSGEGTLPGA